MFKLFKRNKKVEDKIAKSAETVNEEKTKDSKKESEKADDEEAEHQIDALLSKLKKRR